MSKVVYDANGNMTGGPDFTDPDDIATRTIDYNGKAKRGQSYNLLSREKVKDV